MLDSNYTRFLRAVLKKFRMQHPTKQQYDHLPPITKTIQIRGTAGDYWRVRRNSKAIYSRGVYHIDDQIQDDQQEPTYSSSVPISDVALKTCRERWTIEMKDERGSGKSVLAAWHDDDDNEEEKEEDKVIY